MVDPVALSGIVLQCLDEGGHDLQRALEVACAEILHLRMVAGAGIRRRADHLMASELVSHLVWSQEKVGDRSIGPLAP